MKKSKNNYPTKHKFVVVGGGSAGVMAATYLKAYYNTEVVLIYDHKNPGIGVGESLTPSFYSYLNYVGVTREELIKNVNATVKLGLRFKNWLNDGKYYHHGFLLNLETFYNEFDRYNFDTAWAIANNCYNNRITYDDFYYEKCVIPKEKKTESLHIDATLFSKYVENKFKDRLTIMDGVVVDVELLPDNGHIKHVVLSDGTKVDGDFFIDASGFQYALFKHLKNNWIDKQDWLPLNRCIPNPVPYEFKKQPPFTTSEASDQGWILQVPLSNRWGSGYLYCDKFLTDEQAFENFEAFVKKTYKCSLNNTSRVIKFKSGFWEKQWVGNCMAVGLSSGFTEPLEATNIHHVVYQLERFTACYAFKVFKNDINLYNNAMQKFYDNVYLYLRFCYLTNRTDSEFWKYMTNSVPEEVQNLKDKISSDFVNFRSCQDDIFDYNNFTCVAHGLRLIDKKSYKNNVNIRFIDKVGRERYNAFTQEKNLRLQRVMDHRQLIDMVLNN